MNAARDSAGDAALAPPPSNADVAAVLDEVGTLVAAREASPFRAQAYRRAAARVRLLPSPLAALFRAGGVEALAELHAVGPRLAHLVAELLATGHAALLDALRADVDPEAVLRTVPGIGPELARRLHEKLGVDTLEALELAAHDGRLARLDGFGPRRLRGVIDMLAGRLGQGGWWATMPPVATAGEIPVAELLDVDREYRAKAEARRLHRIAPRRFNPTRRAWLPVLHTQRGDRRYTALFSNTARAHQLHKTDDWVVVFVDDRETHRQATIVTESHGPLLDRRVVRGRERECARHYTARNGASLRRAS